MLDLSEISINVLSNIWYLFQIVILILFIKSPYFKGKAGETIVNVVNHVNFDKSDYNTNLKDITMKMNDGTTTQIDHIIVSKFGIFVIETKNMKGWIFGDKDQKTWTQSIYGKKNNFQNPLHQNYKHIKALEELLGL